MIAIYARQSVDREDSISIDSQIEACRYEARGEAYCEYVDRGYSGKNTERPCFKELVKDIKNEKISKVIVYRLDRISRSILDFSNLMVLFSKYQVEFVSSTEKFDTASPMGRAMLNICMVFAQLERETIQQRVTDAYYSRSEKGFYMGGRVPYGFRLKECSINGKHTKTYVPYEEEADQVRLMYDLYSNPDTSYGDIVAYFQEHGITCRGKAWERTRIADHLKNPIYVRADLDIYEFYQRQGAIIESPPEDFVGTNGCYYYKGRNANNRKLTDFKNNRLVLAPHEGLIPSNLWLKCRIKCLRNKQVQFARKTVNTWLAGLVKCGCCHYALTFKKYNTRRSRYLLCSHKLNSGACKGAGIIYADEFESMIFREIGKKLQEFPVLFQNEEPFPQNQKSAELRMERNKVQQEIETLTDKVTLADEVLMRLINRRAGELSARRDELEQELAGYERNHTDENERRQIRNYLNQWDTLTLGDKRLVAASLIEVIYATSEKVDIYWNI